MQPDYVISLSFSYINKKCVINFDSRVSQEELRSLNTSNIFKNDEVYSELLSSHTCSIVHGSIVIFLLIFTLIRSFGLCNICFNSSMVLQNKMFEGKII